MITKHFLEKIYIGKIVLKKISVKSDNVELSQLVSLYKKNKKHLFYWHHGFKQLLFNNTVDIINRIKKCRLICYTVYISNKIIGCIEITKIEKDLGKFNCRTLSFWIDKDNVRKGIMFNCLNTLEKYLNTQGTDVLCAEVNIDNTPSINLLEKSGYKKYGASILVSKEGKTLCKTYSYKKTIKQKAA